MLAVEFHFGERAMVHFTPVDLPEPIRREIAEEYDGQIVVDVRVELPDQVREVYRPNFVLCVSRSDPRSYAFIDRDQVDSARQRVLASAYREIESVEGWRRYFDLKAETRKMMESITGTEAGDDWPEGF